MSSFDAQFEHGDRFDLPNDFGDEFEPDPYANREGITATEGPDDDLSDEILFAEGPEQELTPEAAVQLALGDENPWEGLDEALEDFDPGRIEIRQLGDARLEHFHLGIVVDGNIDVEGWRLGLEEGFRDTRSEFVGDLDRAAECMAAFERGVHFVHMEYRQQGVKMEVPPVRIVTDPRLESLYIGNMAASSEELFVNGHTLESDSEIPPDEVHIIPPPESGQPPGMVATIQDIYFLTGVEEAHHNIRENVKGPCGGSDLSLSFLDYHAYQDWEYEALEWKVMAAKRAGLSLQTIQSLENTLRAATELRAARRAA